MESQKEQVFHSENAMPEQVYPTTESQSMNEPQITFQSQHQEDSQIIPKYPSKATHKLTVYAKLGMITKAKNQIIDLKCQKTDKDTVRTMYNHIYLVRREDLLNACNQFNKRDDCNPEDSLDQWLERSLSVNKAFENDTEHFLKSPEGEVVTLEDIFNSKCSSSRKSKSSSHHSIGSHRSSLSKVASNASSKLSDILMMKMAKCEAGRIVQAELQAIEDDDLEEKQRIQAHKHQMKRRKDNLETKKSNIELGILLENQQLNTSVLSIESMKMRPTAAGTSPVVISTPIINNVLGTSLPPSVLTLNDCISNKVIKSFSNTSSPNIMTEGKQISLPVALGSNLPETSVVGIHSVPIVNSFTPNSSTESFSPHLSHPLPPRVEYDSQSNNLGVLAVREPIISHPPKPLFNCSCARIQASAPMPIVVSSVTTTPTVTTTTSASNQQPMPRVSLQLPTSSIWASSMLPMPKVISESVSTPQTSHNYINLSASSPPFIPVQQVPIPEDSSTTSPITGSEPQEYSYHPVQFQNPMNTPPVSTNAISALQSTINQQAETISAMMRKTTWSDMKSVQLPTFDGTDVTEFRSFMMTFENYIGESLATDLQKFLMLLSVTKSMAHDLVKSCEMPDAAMALQKAKDRLNEQYGNPQLHADAYVAKWQAWPEITDKHDAKAIMALSFFLDVCKTRIELDNTLDYMLNNPFQLYEIAKKLPYKLRKQWIIETSRITQAKEFVRLHHLAAFVKKQALLLVQPGYNRLLLGEYKQPSREKVTQIKTLATSIVPPSSAVPQPWLPIDGKQSTWKQKPCNYCRNLNHLIASCESFKSKSIEFKMNFVRENGLCFSCLRFGHSSRQCRNMKTCFTCNRHHHTTLHDFAWEQLESWKGNKEHIAPAFQSRNQINESNYESMTPPENQVLAVATISSETKHQTNSTQINEES